MATRTACASFHLERHLVGIDFCLFGNLFCHFATLLSHPAVFPGVGDPSKDEPRIAWKETHGALPFVLTEKLDAGEQFGIPESRDPVRRRFAIELFHYALRFIGYHEIAHLAHGHIHLVQSQEITMALFDSFDREHRNEVLRVRALEQHADLHAFFRLALNLFIDSFRFGGSGNALRTTVHIALFAVSSVLRMWANASGPRDLVKDHPHPIIRFIGLLDATRLRLKELKIAEDGWVSGMGDFILHSRIVDESLGCDKPFIGCLDQQDELRREYNSINQDFQSNQLSKDLQEFTFMKPYKLGKLLEYTVV